MQVFKKETNMLKIIFEFCKEIGEIGIWVIVLGILMLIICYRCSDASKKLGLLMFSILLIVIGLILTICWII